MNILNYKYYYFLGIGGIGMSALARFFHHYQKSVSGYDKTLSALTIELEQEKIACHYEEDVNALKKLLSNYNKEEVLIVYTPAVPKEHSEYQYLLAENYTILKRSQVLGEISKQFKTIAIAGNTGEQSQGTYLHFEIWDNGMAVDPEEYVGF